MQVTIDPLTMDTWNMPSMGLTYHLWLAGSPTSVCGFPWGDFWSGGVEVPPRDEQCEKCRKARCPQEQTDAE